MSGYKPTGKMTIFVYKEPDGRRGVMMDFGQAVPYVAFTPTESRRIAQEILRLAQRAEEANRKAEADSNGLSRHERRAAAAKAKRDGQRGR